VPGLDPPELGDSAADDAKRRITIQYAKYRAGHVKGLAAALVKEAQAALVTATEAATPPNLRRYREAAEAAVGAALAGWNNGPPTQAIRVRIRARALRLLRAGPPLTRRARPGPKGGGAAAMRQELERMLADGWEPKSKSPLKEAHAKVCARLGIGASAPRGYGIGVLAGCGNLPEV
jgi:hypothetical protein